MATTAFAEGGVVSPIENSLLTDMYQITMGYAYWKAGRASKPAVFDLYFRKHPFKGSFTIFAGLDEALRFVQAFKFTADQLAYLDSILPPEVDRGYLEFLGSLDTSGLVIYAQAEGSIVSPSVPLLRLEGPLALVQLMETSLLNQINYASLMATNAARFRLAAGFDKTLLEFGLRRAQGPDGALSASRYSYMGGFNGSSNVLAGMFFGMAIKGTHAHAFVSSYPDLDAVDRDLTFLGDSNLKDLALEIRAALGYTQTNDGELAAFISYGAAFPSAFLALVDTYDTLLSGVPNYIVVGTALTKLGFTPRGVRLDSGSLSGLSKATRAAFVAADAHARDVLGLETSFATGTIVASNDINEPVLHALAKEGHEIDAFGIGTHLVTCQAQPALGCVFKLVSIDGAPRIKLSNSFTKMTIPGSKAAYRLYVGLSPVADLLALASEAPPQAGSRILLRSVHDETKRAYVTPTRVDPLINLVWSDRSRRPCPDLEATRSFVLAQLAAWPPALLDGLSTFKVSLTQALYDSMHKLWNAEAPIHTLSPKSPRSAGSPAPPVPPGLSAISSSGSTSAPST